MRREERRRPADGQGGLGQQACSKEPPRWTGQAMGKRGCPSQVAMAEGARCHQCPRPARLLALSWLQGEEPGQAAAWPLNSSRTPAPRAGEGGLAAEESMGLPCPPSPVLGLLTALGPFPALRQGLLETLTRWQHCDSRRQAFPSGSGAPGATRHGSASHPGSQPLPAQRGQCRHHRVYLFKKQAQRGCEICSGAHSR